MLAELRKKLRWPQIKYDPGDIHRVKVQLTYLFGSPPQTRRARERSNVPLLFVGIVGGWRELPTFLNLSLIIVWLGFPQFWYLWAPLLYSSALYLYGSTRSLRLALTRLHLLRIFRASDVELNARLAEPPTALFRFFVDFLDDPFPASQYVDETLPKIGQLRKWATRVSRGALASYIVSLASLGTFVFDPLADLAYLFVGGLVLSMMALVLSVVLSLRIEDLKALAPPAWRPTDFARATSQDEFEEQEDKED
jgi:hypothetical protein